MAPSASLAPASAPLSEVLLAAARAVQAVLAGTSLTDALSRVTPDLRPAAQAVSFHAMRQLGRARAVRQALIPRKPSDALLDALLLTAFSLLVVDEAEAAGAGVGYAAHTVVDQAVRAAAGQRFLAPFKGLVNASLRRFLREREQVLETTGRRPEAAWNHPEWWVRRLRTDYPGQWQDLLRAANRPAAMVLRVNRRRTSREALLAAFREAGIEGWPVGEAAVVLSQARPVHQLPGFAEGWWSVQDAAAQLAAPLLQVRDGMRVLDACAAPGGKTAHLLEMADVDLLALDVDAERLARVDANLARLGLAARTQAADVADLDSWWDGQAFDAVLADVPCTASGIVRRHPDIRWLRREGDIANTTALQARIVDALWQVVAPGGKLLYATCSIFPAEGVKQAEAFQLRHPDAARLPAPGQLLTQAEPDRPAEQHDGFFYALFAKV
ncbi:MAG: 16S rRNA (cytosine(967)-C(5))-methyltransferase RsmB [Pigmentiphaga sp.]|uniref:16S rRNA (cytosine(967)-C(5))-methyltransferase RsmB n=1 Tax=Pigmentiphaga sp. TaxID=1977564 RepID=UPI0029AB2A32|nr:16S rRNA (cytosine(967)-C(5))-methyltransferase RsmB [Pigmentiphaga sp.]MDX3906020.1 16S rRNA (cytosine(967)-C(5))-methyltransferase RsmB [Pigmentiphaga sp.]